MQPVIRVENLSKRYQLGLTHAGSVRELVNRTFAGLTGRRREKDAGKGQDNDADHVWALRDVSFDVYPGEVLGIIGANGAGKSTLLKILSRITAPSGGRVEMRGRVASLLEVGTGFHPELTGRENVYMNGTVLGMTRKEIDRAFDSIVDFAGVETFIDTPVKRYSSGMTVRLGFAVAAHMSPEILIIDEVLAVGDAEFQKRCIGKMDDVAKSGRTVLFVSHNMAAVSKLCGSCVYIDHGKVADSGLSKNVIERYLADSFSQSPNDPCVLEQKLTQHKENIELDVVLHSVEITDDKSKPCSTFRIGDSLNIKLEYFARKQIDHVAFGVVVADSNGVELLRLSTSPISGFDVGRILGKGILELTISQISLTGGNYSISIYASRPKIEFLWKLENLLLLEITPTDAYDSGFAMDNKAGLIVAEHYWSHRP